VTPFADPSSQVFFSGRSPYARRSCYGIADKRESLRCQKLQFVSIGPLVAAADGGKIYIADAGPVDTR
jgi:hypothetical protein